MKTNPPNNAFCIAAWTHTYISPQSERRLCCASREDFQFAGQYLGNRHDNNKNSKTYEPISLRDHWNSDFLKSIRLKMLNGDIPDECIACHETNVGTSSYRDYFNTKAFPDLIQAAIDNTSNDGSTTMEPISFDYRFSNKCNFSCRMCGPQLSSKREKEVIENKLWTKESEPWLIKENKERIQQFQTNILEKEFLQAITQDSVREIYWAGGEPLIWEIHWESMKHLIDSGLASKTSIRYNTNLSLTSFRDNDLFDNFLIHFKKVIIFASIDATEKIGEYIRTGLVWSNWKRNLIRAKEFCDQADNSEVFIDLTLTLPGLFDLKNLIDFSNEFEITILSKLIITYDTSVVLSPLALPREELDSILTELIKYNKLKISNYNANLLKTLVKLKSSKTYEENDPKNFKENFNKGREKQLYTEKIRKDKFTLSDIYKERPGIYRWWNQ